MGWWWGDGLWPREAHGVCEWPRHSSSLSLSFPMCEMGRMAFVSWSTSRCLPQCSVAATPAGLTFNMLKWNLYGPQVFLLVNSPCSQSPGVAQLSPLTPRHCCLTSLCCLKFLLLPPFTKGTRYLSPGLCNCFHTASPASSRPPSSSAALLVATFGSPGPIGGGPLVWPNELPTPWPPITFATFSPAILSRPPASLTHAPWTFHFFSVPHIATFFPRS